MTAEERVTLDAHDAATRDRITMIAHHYQLASKTRPRLAQRRRAPSPAVRARRTLVAQLATVTLLLGATTLIPAITGTL